MSTRRFQVPLWLFMLSITFAGLATAVAIQGLRERHHYQGDFALLQGNWGQLSFSGDKYKIEGPMTDVYGRFQIRADLVPKRITFQPSHPDTPLHHGIYRFSGDTLELCLTTRGNSAPTRFRHDPESGWYLFQYHRW